MANPHGDFIWYELMTPQAEAAAAFYAQILGWRIRPAPVSGEATGYRLVNAGQADIAGILPQPGGPARWLGYVGVDDLDASFATVLRLGGTAHLPPTDIPGVGRFALVADPQGALLYLMRGAMEGTSTAFAPAEGGHCHWNELTTTDQPAALAFYRAAFGWEPGDAMSMGALGDYRFLHHHGGMFGAMMNRRPEGPPPAWRFYFGVADIDAAAAAVTAGGGAIHHGPNEVPGGLFALNAADPQGGAFGLVGPRPG